MLAPFDSRYKNVARKRLREEVRDPFAPDADAARDAVTISRVTVEQLLGMPSRQSATYRAEHSTPIVTLNPLDVIDCFDALNKGVPHACMQRINAELTQSGLRFSRHDGEILPTDYMQSWIDNVLIPLQQDALRAICAIGVVPIAWRRDPASGYNLPYVPAPGSYTIGVGQVRGVTYYTLYWISPATIGHLRREHEDRKRARNSNDPNERIVASSNFLFGANTLGKPDRSVTILHGFNHDPGIFGEINSVVTSFLDNLEEASAFKRNARVAEAINANPPIARQFNSKLDDAKREALRGTGFVGEGVLDPIAEGDARRVNAQFLRTNQQIAAYNAQTREAEEHIKAACGIPITNTQPMCTATSRHPRDPAATDAEGNPMPWKNELAVPEGWTLVPTPMARPRSDLVNVLEHLDNDVFFAFLIPRQALDATARLVADATTAKETMEIAVSVWKRALSHVLTFAHDSSYVDYDFTLLAAKIIRQNRERAKKRSDDDDGGDGADEQEEQPPMTNEQLMKILDDIGRVRVSYRSKPTTTNEALDRIHARGVIDWEDYTHYTAQLNGIDPDRVVETDRFNADAKRMMGMPEYGTYLQIKDARDRETTRADEAQTEFKQRDREIDVKATALTAKTAADDTPAATAKRRKTATTKKK